MNQGTMWSDTKTPWEDLAREDTDRINAWRDNVACNWSFLEKTVGFTEFGHLGGIYWQEGGNNKDVVWVTEKELIKTTVFKKPFIPAFTAIENALTPVARVERYKNWIRQLCNRGGYCYLILFKRRYRPYAFLLYGKNPQLGDLNLDVEYRSEVFKDLNIAVNYEKRLIHVYRAVNVVYAEGFEKYKDNDQLIDNWWLPHYIVGATEIRRTDLQPEGSTQPQGGEIHHGSDYVPSEYEESSASRARRQKREKEKAKQRQYINSLMTGGMTSIQGHMTSQQEQELKKDRDYYKKKAQRLEKKYGKKPDYGSSRGSQGSDGSGSSAGSRSYLFDGGDPSEPDTVEHETIDKYKDRFEGAKGPKMNIPDTFTGDRTDTTRFIRQCKVYFVTKRKEFTSEMDKMLWITSLCDGEAVEGWVDWITSMLNEKNEKAPKKASEMLAFLGAYFGDPDEVLTARHKLDQLKQTKRIEEYVIAFQSVAYKTKYTEAELEHRFIVGLKQEI